MSKDNKKVDNKSETTDEELDFEQILKLTPNENNVENLLAKMQKLMSNMDEDAEIQPEIQSWIDKALFVLQGKQLVDEIRLTLKDYSDTEQSCFLTSAKNLLTSYGEFYKNAYRQHIVVNSYQFVEELINKTIEDRDQRYFNENIYIEIEKLSDYYVDNIISPNIMQMKLQEIDSIYNSVKDKCLNLIKPSIDLTNTLNDFNNLHEKKIFDIFSNRIKYLCDFSSYDPKHKLELITDFLTESGSGKNLVSIKNDELRQKFSQQIKDLQKETEKLRKQLFDEYQRVALNKIFNSNTLYDKLPTFGKGSVCVKIIKQNLSDLDITKLSLEVRRVYDEVFNNLYKEIDLKERLELAEYIQNTNKLDY